MKADKLSINWKKIRVLFSFKCSAKVQQINFVFSCIRSFYREKKADLRAVTSLSINERRGKKITNANRYKNKSNLSLRNFQLDSLPSTFLFSLRKRSSDLSLYSYNVQSSTFRRAEFQASILLFICRSTFLFFLCLFAMDVFSLSLSI